MSDIQPNIILTEEQIAIFHREGYLVIDAISTEEEVARLRAIYDRMFQERAGREVGDQFDLAGTDEEGEEAALPQILHPAKYAPELGRTLYRANATAIAKQLFGQGTKLLGEHAIFKPPRTGAETPWHQDAAYRDGNLDHLDLSVWVPLQEATLENGCMQFIPGSHKLDVLPHHSIKYDPRIHGLEVDSVDTSKAVACPLPAGGATIHHFRTLHYAGPNRSNTPRRAYIMVFGLEPKPRKVPHNYYWNTQKQTPREERRRATEDSLGAGERDVDKAGA